MILIAFLIKLPERWISPSYWWLAHPTTEVNRDEVERSMCSYNESGATPTEIPLLRITEH